MPSNSSIAGSRGFLFDFSIIHKVDMAYKNRVVHHLG